LSFPRKRESQDYPNETPAFQPTPRLQPARRRGDSGDPRFHGDDKERMGMTEKEWG